MRRGGRGQSMVEFSFVVIPFLLLLLGAVTAGLHAVEREVAESAAANGVEVAATTTQPNDPTQPQLAAATAPTLQLLRPAMLGTEVRVLPAGRTCDAVGAIPVGTVEVCLWLDGSVRDAQGRPALVAETIRGTPATLIPWVGALLPDTLDLTLEARAVTYQP
ncbi:MAG: TadE/TadG family type IV pilus assembly protein [Candidatus Dormiibacterota bacterium]